MRYILDKKIKEAQLQSKMNDNEGVVELSIGMCRIVGGGETTTCEEQRFRKRNLPSYGAKNRREG